MAILKGAKTLTQMAAELGTIKTIVRRWLRRDHWDLWMAHWASVEERWEAGERGRQRQVGRLADGQRSSESKAALDLSLARLLAGSDEPDGELISGLSMAIGLLAGLPDSWSDRLKRGSI